MAYSKLVMEHFKNPKNQGQISNADAIGKVGNPLCGDVMEIYIKVKKNAKDLIQSIISDIKFQTLGCAAAIACSSVLTEMAKDKTLKEAFDISRQDIVSGLGELPPIKLHCSVLASDGLKLAIKNYLEKTGDLDKHPEIKNFKIEEYLH